MEEVNPTFDAIICPTCNRGEIRLANYTSLMVLKPGLGLFGIECPHCGERISSIHTIPPYLNKEVLRAAIEVGAGMGQTK